MTKGRSKPPPEAAGALPVRIVLVAPSHPGNIGAAARAMKTMGLSELALVRPERFPDPQAEWRAAAAVDVLRSATVCDSLAAAVAGCALVAGTSARRRHLPWPWATAADFARQVAARSVEAARPVAVLFGREASGLTNDELESCQLHVEIPAHPAYPSLNLAMAVQVVCYELRQAQLRRADTETPPVWDRPLASAEALAGLYRHLEEALRDIGFLHAADSAGAAMSRLKRLFGRVRLDETEVAMLRGILRHAARAAASRLAGGDALESRNEVPSRLGERSNEDAADHQE